MPAIAPRRKGIPDFRLIPALSFAASAAAAEALALAHGWLCDRWKTIRAFGPYQKRTLFRHGKAWKPEMKHATSRELFSYWCRLRGERTAPERADVDPAAIRNILADTFILEIGGADDFTIRVVGARVTAVFGRELKGESLLTLWREDDRRAASALIGAVLDEAAPAIAGAATSPKGRIRCELELLLLPLRHHGRTHARILGSLSPGSVPSWLGLIASEPMSLVSTRMIGVEEGRSRVEGTAFAWGPSEPERRRHLFVHEGGR